MGGYQSQNCLEELCIRYTGVPCKNSLEVVPSGSTEETRVLCGQLLGPLASEVTTTEIVDAITSGKLPVFGGTDKYVM